MLTVHYNLLVLLEGGGERCRGAQQAEVEFNFSLKLSFE